MDGKASYRGLQYSPLVRDLSQSFKTLHSERSEAYQTLEPGQRKVSNYEENIEIDMSCNNLPV